MTSLKQAIEQRIEKAASERFHSEAFKKGAEFLLPELLLAVEELEFYAKEKNYLIAYRTDTGEYVAANSDVTALIEIDKGKRARHAIEQIRKKLVVE
jgi:hypothetical protein